MMKFGVDAESSDIDRLRELSGFSPAFNAITQAAQVIIQIEQEW